MKNIKWLMIGLLITSCGGAVGTGGSSTTSSTDSTSGSSSDSGTVTDTTVAELLAGGIQVDSVADTVAGTTWKITSYDLGDTSSTIETSDNDADITFSEDGSIASLVKYTESGTNNFSAPPLYDYRVSPYSNWLDEYVYEGNAAAATIEDNPIHASYEGGVCGDGFCDCSAPYEYCVVQTYGDRITPSYFVVYEPEDQQMVDGLYDAELQYGISGSISRPTLSIVLSGNDYAPPCSTSPADNSDFVCPVTYGSEPTPVVEETDYDITAMTDNLMLIDTDDVRIILVKE